MLHVIPVSNFSLTKYNVFKPFLNARYLFQLHHVHGGLQRCHHHHDPQLPPSALRHPQNAKLGNGKYSNFSWLNMFLNMFFAPGTNPFSPVDPLAVEDVSSRRKDHSEDDPDPEQDEGDGHEGELLEVPAGERARHGR